MFLENQDWPSMTTAGDSLPALSLFCNDSIIATYRPRHTLEKYAYLAPFEEVEQNDFNLNIPRYVATFESEPDVDLMAVNNEIVELDLQLAAVSTEIARYLKELGLHD